MALTELQCKKAKPTGKDRQITDTGGLALLVRAKGTKLWRYEYRLGGKKHKCSYGNYPEISLADARALHTAARRLVELGRHPAEVLDDGEAKRAILAGHGLAEVEAMREQAGEQAALAARMTFGEAASRYKTEWLERRWKKPEVGYAPIRLHLLPKLGSLALEDIEAPMLREMFYGIRERRGTQAALMAHGCAARVFSYALEHGWCRFNPAQAVKATRIGDKSKRKRHLPPTEIKRYLAALYQADCYRGYKLALHLLLMLALRKNELCGANWREFDLEAGEWSIPPGRMKGKREHVVFLPVQAVDMLRELQRLGSGSEWVLPQRTNPGRPMDGDNLNPAHSAAIIAAGIEDYVIHDHRHTASSRLRDMGHPHEVIEAALSHAMPGVAGTYNHSQYKSQRLTMLQEWADFLDGIMNEKTVIQATFRKAS